MEPSDADPPPGCEPEPAPSPVEGEAEPRPPPRRPLPWAPTAAALVLVTGGAFAFIYTRDVEVHVCNSLDVPLRVTLGDETRELAPASHAVVETAAGSLHVTARRTDGRIVEELDVEVPRFADLVAYNVLGASPLVVKAVPFGPREFPLPEPFFFGGEPFVVAMDGVDDVFRPPPATAGPDDPPIRWHADVPVASWQVTADALLSPPPAPERVRALLRQVLLAQPEVEGTSWDVIGLDARAFPDDFEGRVALFREAVEQAPASVEAHRGLQMALEEAGRRQAARAEYRARYDREPTPDNGYLLGRLLPDAEGLAMSERLTARHPDHAQIQGLRATLLLGAGRWDEAAAGFARAVELSPELGPRVRPDWLAALAGAGRVDEALRIAEAVPRPTWHDAVAYALLVRLAGAAASRPERDLFLRAFEPGEPTPEEVGSFALALGDEPTDEELAAFTDERVRRIVRLEREVLRDPVAALAQAHALPLADWPSVDQGFALLLAGEAVRSGEEALTATILRSFWSDADALALWLRAGLRPDTYPNPWALALVARARVVGGREADLLVAEAHAIDPLRGLAGRVANRWFGKLGPVR